MKILHTPHQWRGYRAYRDIAHSFIGDSFEKTGDQYARLEAKVNVPPCDLLVSWGPCANRIALAAAPRNLMLEAGHLGDRLTNLSVTWNGLASLGVPALPESLNVGRGERFYDLIQTPENDDPPKRMIIMGQCPNDHSLHSLGFGASGNPGQDLKGRLEAYKSWMASHYTYWVSQGMEVKVKLHPMQGGKRAFKTWLQNHGVQIAPDDMGECLEWADAATALCSTALVECALHGLYVVPGHSMAMTWPVRSSRLAWRRFSEGEMQSWIDWVVRYQMTKEEFATFWPKIRETI